MLCKYQVKLFHAEWVDELEDMVNKWLNDRRTISIGEVKIVPTRSGYFAHILYYAEFGEEE